MSVLPAHPTVSRPSSSLSRLMRIEPVDERPVERVRALEPDLLGDRHQQLERPVRQRLVLDERHHRGDRDAVVGARASSRPRSASRRRGRARSGPRPGRSGSTGRARRPCRGAPGATTSRGALAARRRRHADDEVAARVLLELEPVLGRPRAHVLDHRLLVPRRPRDPRQRLEVRPERDEARGPLRTVVSGHVSLPLRRSAFCFSASNSACVIAPESRSCLPCRSRPPRRRRSPAVCRTYWSNWSRCARER